MSGSIHLSDKQFALLIGYLRKLHEELERIGDILEDIWEQRQKCMQRRRSDRK